MNSETLKESGPAVRAGMLSRILPERSVGLISAVALAASGLGCGEDVNLESLLLSYERKTRPIDGQGALYKVDGFLLSKSSDDGLSWGGVDSIPARGYAVWGHSLACGESDVLYFAHVGIADGGKEIFVSRSFDGGRTWTIPTAANEIVRAQRTDPKVLVTGVEVYVAWVERGQSGLVGEGRPGGVYVTCSRNGGVDWEEDRWLREGEDCWLSAADDGTVYLAYTGGETNSILYVSYTTDRGRSWKSELAGEVRMLVKEPYVLSAGNELYIFFKGGRPTLSHISSSRKLEYRRYYRSSRDRGKTWSGIVDLDRGTGT